MVDITQIAKKIQPFMDDKESILVVQEIIKEMDSEDDSEVPNKMMGLLMKFGFGPSDGIANFGGHEVRNFKLVRTKCDQVEPFGRTGGLPMG